MLKHIAPIAAVAFLLASCGETTTSTEATESTDAATEQEVMELEESANKMDAATAAIDSSAANVQDLINDLDN